MEDGILRSSTVASAPKDTRPEVLCPIIRGYGKAGFKEVWTRGRIVAMREVWEGMLWWRRRVTVYYVDSNYGEIVKTREIVPL